MRRRNNSRPHRRSSRHAVEKRSLITLTGRGGRIAPGFSLDSKLYRDWKEEYRCCVVAAWGKNGDVSESCSRSGWYVTR